VSVVSVRITAAGIWAISAFVAAMRSSSSGWVANQPSTADGFRLR